MKLSNRLLAVCDMVSYKADIIDVGCDHGLVSIYLVKNKFVTALCTDINEKALKGAIDNIHKYSLTSNINYTVTDGVNNLDIKNKTILIIGMGTSTIRHIINDIKELTMKEIIIGSNNDIKELRLFMVSKGFYIQDEAYIVERGKHYVIIKFIVGNKKYKKIDYIAGPILKVRDKEYLKYLINKNNLILTKIPIKHFIKRLHLQCENRLIKKELNK